MYPEVAAKYCHAAFKLYYLAKAILSLRIINIGLHCSQHRDTVAAGVTGYYSRRSRSMRMPYR